MRHRFELNRDLGGLRRQDLTRAQIERNPLPAPIVDEQAQRTEGGGLGSRVDAVLAAIALVLPAQRMPVGLVLGNRADGLQHLLPFIAQRLGIERGRGLHRHHRQELQQVVLEDVAQDADRVVEMAAMLDADGLGGGDLDMVDVIAVPDGLEDAVGEAQHQHVLDGLFAEVVIDAVDLIFAQVTVQIVVESAGRLQIAAERLLDHARRQPSARRSIRPAEASTSGV
jgi:hypothetical protein